MLNLDTHILIFALTDKLTPIEKKFLQNDIWSISSIVLWELSKLAQLGRISIDLNDADVIRVLSNIHTWPLDLKVCKAIANLDFKSDPADEIIAATSVVHQVPLVTRDKKILKSKLVPFTKR